MKDLVEFMNESLTEGQNTKLNEDQLNEGEIKDEKAFREYAEKKLKEVHGDDFDADKAKETIDGILKDNKDLVDKGDWGALVGVLNKGVVK